MVKNGLPRHETVTAARGVGRYRSAWCYARRGGARGDAWRPMTMDAIANVTIISRSWGDGGAAGAGAGGVRKCRTWSRLRHTGQSVASWPGTRRALMLR